LPHRYNHTSIIHCDKATNDIKEIVCFGRDEHGSLFEDVWIFSKGSHTSYKIVVSGKEFHEFFL
jgi:hypothetical protein